jgi:hypothetical protein
MSRILEFFLGSILITVFTVAFMFFSALHYLLRAEGIADCVWSSSVTAWIDSNGDGLFNRNESPLREVEIHVDDLHNQRVDAGWPAITDQNGEADLYVSIPGCSETVFEVYVDIPEGYRLTTRPRIEVEPVLWQAPGTRRAYSFGLLPAGD